MICGLITSLQIWKIFRKSKLFWSLQLKYSLNNLITNLRILSELFNPAKLLIAKKNVLKDDLEDLFCIHFFYPTKIYNIGWDRK